MMQPKDYAQLLYDVLENKNAGAQNQILKRFKNLLTRNKDTRLRNTIEKELGKIQEQKRQEKVTYISSAAELGETQKQKLVSSFPEPYEFLITRELLGGIAVRKGDKVYNATLRKKIELLKS